MDNDAAAVPAFKIIPLDYLSTAAYYWMFDSSRALTDEEGLQFVESQPTTLDPVNVVYKTKEIFKSLWAEMLFLLNPVNSGKVQFI